MRESKWNRKKKAFSINHLYFLSSPPPFQLPMISMPKEKKDKEKICCLVVPADCAEGTSIHKWGRKRHIKKALNLMLRKVKKSNFKFSCKWNTRNTHKLHIKPSSVPHTLKNTLQSNSFKLFLRLNFSTGLFLFPLIQCKPHSIRREI